MKVEVLKVQECFFLSSIFSYSNSYKKAGAESLRHR